MLSQIEINVLSIIDLIEKSDDFKNLIKDPTVSQNDLSKAIDKIFDYLKIENLLKNFTNFLVIKGDFSL